VLGKLGGALANEGIRVFETEINATSVDPFAASFDGGRVVLMRPSTERFTAEEIVAGLDQYLEKILDWLYSNSISGPVMFPIFSFEAHVALEVSESLVVSSELSQVDFPDPSLEFQEYLAGLARICVDSGMPLSTQISVFINIPIDEHGASFTTFNYHSDALNVDHDVRNIQNIGFIYGPGNGMLMAQADESFESCEIELRTEKKRLIPLVQYFPSDQQLIEAGVFGVPPGVTVGFDSVRPFPHRSGSGREIYAIITASVPEAHFTSSPNLNR